MCCVNCFRLPVCKLTDLHLPKLKNHWTQILRSVNQLNQPHGAESFLIIEQLHRWSRKSPHFTESECSLPHSQEPAQPHSEVFRNIVSFWGENLLETRPNTTQDDNHLTSVRHCTFNIFAATLHVCRPFLHHQREEAPCRGDKERYSTDSVNKENDRVP